MNRSSVHLWTSASWRVEDRDVSQTSELNGSIAAAAVDNEDLFVPGKLLESIQRSGDPILFVERGNDNAYQHVKRGERLDSQNARRALRAQRTN